MLKSSQKDFIKRHIGPSEADQQKMLNELGFDNLDDLISKTVPEKILLKEDLGIGEPNSEYEALRKLKVISKQNRIYFVPHSSHSQLMYIDCSVGSISTFLHGLQILNNAYAGGVYSPTEDKIYFVPYAQNTKFCYIDCSNTNVVEYVSNVAINQNS